MSQLNALNQDDNQLQVETYEFEPIKGYPRLHWKGKRPFRSTNYYPAQLKESYCEPVDEWMNEIYWGDNLHVMSHLLKKYRGKIKLIYIDPPFDSKANYKKKISRQSEKIQNEYSGFEEKQYNDIWTNDEYLQFIYERFIILRELLSSEGSIFIHCDWHKSHYLRCILDEIFGGDHFINEIIWYYPDNFQGNVHGFATNHNNIFWYSKTEIYTTNKVFIELDKPVKRDKRIWSKKEQKLVAARDEKGNIVYETFTHKKADDVWVIGQSSITKSRSKEYLGYPTQKPEALLERIIQASSNPGDLIFDCFMGCGTTQAVAMKLGRRFIGADINAGAIQTTVKRLINVAQELKSKADSKYYTGFSVYNVHYYDIFRNELEARDLIIKALEIQPLNSGSYFDGTKDEYKVKIMPINRIATRKDVTDLVNNLEYKSYEKIKTENPLKTVDNIMLVCMGHEPDITAHFKKETEKYRINLKVYDILRDGSHLTFKYDNEAKIEIKNNILEIKQFYPRMLLQKLKQQNETVSDFRELVESVMIDPYYDGSVFSPTIIDIPDKRDFIHCKYKLPADHGTVAVKITDLLSETCMEVING